ncbi:hypothetical protein PIB30_085199 [Stylosanthes scabra]|uniref:Uncharacterized protein n=1 Tax=Stylosanthes scabra TaxID=79078 RepID=A0ABU6VR89_9FABA|nr:hypothetical protein [Stylosanthes scabra]
MKGCWSPSNMKSENVGKTEQKRCIRVQKCKIREFESDGGECRKRLGVDDAAEQRLGVKEAARQGLGMMQKWFVGCRGGWAWGKGAGRESWRLGVEVARLGVGCFRWAMGLGMSGHA